MGDLMAEHSGWQIYLSVLPAVVGSLVLIALSIVTLVRDGKSNLTNRLFSAICFMGGLINVDVALMAVVGDDGTALAIDRIVYLFFVFSPPLFIHFTHAYLGIDRSRPVAAGYLLSLALFPFTQLDFFIAGHHRYAFGRIAKPGPLYYVFLIFAAVSIFYCLVLMLKHMTSVESNQDRNRMKYISIGFGLGALLILFNGLPVMGVSCYPLGNFSFIPAIVLAFGILKYDLLDLRLAVGRGFYYFFLAATLTVFYVVILTFFNLFLVESSRNPLLFSIIVAVSVILLYEPLKASVMRLIDTMYFKGRYNYRSMLKEASDTLTSLLCLNEIGSYTVGSIHENLKLASTCLYVTDSETNDVLIHEARGHMDSWPATALKSLERNLMSYFGHSRRPLTVSSLETVRLAPTVKHEIRDFMKSAGIVLVFIIPFERLLRGVLMLGEKRSGDLFTSEDMQLLLTMVNQAAMALGNAHSYERLEVINRELEKRVRERTVDLERMIEEKERTTEQLIKSESLAAVGQLVAGTAHELNNPLASALSLTESSMETLADSGDREESRREVMDDLAFAAKELRRAEKIIKSLLSLSRRNDDSSELVDINDVIEDALRVLHGRYKKRDISITRDYCSVNAVVEGNFAQLGQALINIINNALQALPERGGTVSLTSRVSERDKVLWVECRDNGHGIAEQNLRDVFKPFYTTRKPGEGTGLGLYIAHEIIRRYRGFINIESEEGKGTVVTVQIPLVKDR